MTRPCVAIAANFTAEPIRESLAFWIDTLALPLDVAFAPYDQIFQQLLDPSSLLSANVGGVNVVLLKLQDWLATPSQGADGVLGFERNVDELVSALRSAQARSATPILLMLCPAAPLALADSLTSTRLDRAAATLRSEFDGSANVHVVTSAELLREYPIASYYDSESEALGHIPYTQLFFAALGTAVARRTRAARSSPYKVVVLDCDNTLWRGVVGEAGPMGVEIDDAMRSLQELIVRQHDAGMLVCLCSKNNEPDVREVFSRRSEMALTWDHVVTSRINWEPKSANLRSLAAELDLGLDSFVFIDDSPFEIAEVSANAPEVLALQLPTDPDGIRRFAEHCWAFDRSHITDADRKRAASYKENALREVALKQAGGLEEFLQNLQLVLEFAAPTARDFARAAQMTQRTNQFNATTIRRTEAEIQQACLDGSLEARIVSVRDRFGDYGVVGLMLFSTLGAILRVDTLLLSCRALGRRVEQRMLAEVGRIAQARRLSTIEIPFVRTAKNTPALDFLTGLGVEPEQRDDSLVFAVTPELALEAPTMPFHAGAAGASNRDEAGPVAATSGSTASSELMSRIIQTLSRPAELLEAIAANKGRTRGSDSSTFVEPRNDTEQAIVNIWKGVLRLDRVGVTDNFFDLGGDSLAAVPMFVQLRRRFDASLSPTLLLHAPTVERLARAITNGQSKVPNRHTSLVPIQPDGARSPLFCVHAGAGTILFYYPLAKALGTNLPVYAFQSEGLYGGRLPQASLDDMAAHYIAEMRTVQPRGPYRLAGFCLGATIAFEMAIQLQEVGEEIQFLGSFDGLAPFYRGGPGKADTGPRSTLQRIIDRGVIRAKQLRNKALFRYTRRFGGPVPAVFRRFGWYFLVNNHLAKRNYRPSSVFAGTMHVFTIMGRYKEPHLGWRDWVEGEVRSSEIPGDFRAHRDLMDEPMVSRVAFTLDGLLTSAPVE